MNFLDIVLQPWCIVAFAVVMFVVFLTMGKTSKRP